MSQVRSGRIPIAGPSITQREIDYVADAARTAWYDDANVFHQRFEEAFAAYLGVRHAVALPSATSGLHLSLLALGVGPGDEVIVPDVTWIASSAPISYVGATPVFADIDPGSWCLAEQALAEQIGEKTRAVIAVDLYGSVPEFDALRQVAERHGLAIVEDAAEAIGSEYRGRRAGSLGDVGVFSFHGSKTLTTGEGGMLVTDRDDLFDRVLFLRDHARRPGDTGFFNQEIGYKYKMSSMQAALGLAQTERITELVDRKREIFAWYQEDLAGVAGITLNEERPGTRNSYWMVTVLLDPERGVDRDQLATRLKEHRIDTRPFFHPLSSLPAYSEVPKVHEARERNRVSYAVSPRGLNLPSALDLTRDEVAYVCETLDRLLR